jgi:hypothetical protein
MDKGLFYQMHSFSNLPNTEIFHFVLISFVIFITLTRLICVDISHVLAFGIVLMYFQYMNHDNVSNVSNKNVYYSNLLDDIIKYTYITDKIYLQEDIDAVELLDSIKYNFTYGKRNHSTYKNIVNSMNSFFRLKNIMDVRVCYSITPPDLLKNWDNDFSFKINCSSKKRVDNIKEIFEESLKQAKLCLNYTHSLIINTKSQVEKHAIHDENYKKMKVILYRHLDEMFRILKRQKNISKAELDVLGFDFKILNRTSKDMFDTKISNSFEFEI